MTSPGRQDSRAAPRSERRAWARRHARALFVFFAGLLLAGLVLANVFAVVAGAAGLAWVALARWRP